MYMYLVVDIAEKNARELATQQHGAVHGAVHSAVHGAVHSAQW